MKYGDPKLPERIWDKIYTIPFSGCWLFVGATGRKGYGKVWYRGKSRRVHRLTKQFKRTADHKCLERLCCNPDHTRDMTRGKNSRLANLRRWQACAKNG